QSCQPTGTWPTSVASNPHATPEMGGNPGDTLDRTDLGILAQLQREGRATNAQIAASVDLTAPACLQPIPRLESEGVISGYAAVVDPQAVGLGLQAFVRVQLERHGTAEVQRFVKRVHSWSEVVACHALTGEMDYLLHVVVSDLEHFSRFLL